MIQQALITGGRLTSIAAVFTLLSTTVLLWQGCSPGALKVKPGKFPEELVYVRSKDDITNGGAIFTPPADSAKPIAVIWIHGWGVNFYYPTYVMIGRALAERGYTSISANTRMHDLGTVAGYRDGKRIRGGGYWGVASEEAGRNVSTKLARCRQLLGVPDSEQPVERAGLDQLRQGTGQDQTCCPRCQGPLTRQPLEATTTAPAPVPLSVAAWCGVDSS